MHECEVGEVFTLTEWKLKSPKFAKEINSDIRIILTRWVTVAKNEAVRSRLVIKDVASGDSARSLGISSPTPSSDGFMIFVAVTAHFDWRVASLDVAHAFMHTPRVLKDVAVTTKFDFKLRGNMGFVASQSLERLTKCFSGMVTLPTVNAGSSWTSERKTGTMSIQWGYAIWWSSYANHLCGRCFVFH